MIIKTCSKCGGAMSDAAVFCESCGDKKVEELRRPQGPYQGEIIESTRILTGQQVIIASILFIGMGIIGLIMSIAIPDDDFFADMRIIFPLMGVVMIGIGLAIYFLGTGRINRGY
jgi:hypothetical protein